MTKLTEEIKSSIIQKITEDGLQINKNIKDLSHLEISTHVHRMSLIQEIQEGFINDEDKINKWLELIELVYEWSLDTDFQYEHRLEFNNGIIEIESISEDCCGNWLIDYRDNQLYLDDKEFGDSMYHLLNYIEGCL